MRRGRAPPSGSQFFFASLSSVCLFRANNGGWSHCWAEGGWDISALASLRCLRFFPFFRRHVSIMCFPRFFFGWKTLFISLRIHCWMGIPFALRLQKGFRCKDMLMGSSAIQSSLSTAEEKSRNSSAPPPHSCYSIQPAKIFLPVAHTISLTALEFFPPLEVENNFSISSPFSLRTLSWSCCRCKRR